MVNNEGSKEEVERAHAILDQYGYERSPEPGRSWPLHLRVQMACDDAKDARGWADHHLEQVEELEDVANDLLWLANNRQHRNTDLWWGFFDAAVADARKAVASGTAGNGD